MARPQKSGLDYFPLDVNVDQDDKVMLIESEFGIIGFGIIIKMLCKIYANGYFYEWGEKEQLLFSKRVNVDINEVNDCINSAIKWELFDKNVFENYKILTSKGIQKRYLEAIGRRKTLDIIKNYWLIDIPESEKMTINLINVDINEVNADINSNNNEVNVNINSQSKVKKSKVNKRKENESNNKSEAEAPDNYVIDLPTNKFNTENENYYVTDEFYKTMIELYPNVNVLDEFKKMKAWLLTNTSRRKTLKGMEKFINSWLSRQQDQSNNNSNNFNNFNNEPKLSGNPFFDLLREEGKM